MSAKRLSPATRILDWTSNRDDNRVSARQTLWGVSVAVRLRVGAPSEQQKISLLIELLEDPPRRDQDEAPEREESKHPGQRIENPTTDR